MCVAAGEKDVCGCWACVCSMELVDCVVQVLCVLIHLLVVVPSVTKRDVELPVFQ